MKKKEIEKIPFRGGVRADKQYRNAAVAFLQNIREESHLFVEVYENKKRELQTPWIRMVFTQKDWGLYYPDAGVWSAAGLDEEREKIGSNCKKRDNKCYMARSQGDIVWKFAGDTWERKYTTWVGALQSLIYNIKAQRVQKREDKRADRLKEREQNTPPLPKGLEDWAKKTGIGTEHFLYYKRHGRYADIACSACGQVTEAAVRSKDTYEGQFEKIIPVPQHDSVGTCPHCGATGIYKAQGKAKGVWGHGMNCFIAQRYKDDGAVIRYVEIEKIYRLDTFLDEKERMIGAGEKMIITEIARTYLEKGKRPQTDYHKFSSYSGEFWDDCNLCGMNNISIKAAKIYPESYKELRTTFLRYSAAEMYGKHKTIRKAKARLKKYKVLEMPDTAKAEYLTRTFDESGVEILKKAIEQDIHKFSHIPCMSDESFGGNVSGVAMEFKLLGMENITKIKTRYYKKGLRKRIRIFCNYLALHGISIDPSGITMTFTRALPKNLLEISQIVANLWGKVSRKTLLSQVPFVDDVDEELKALETEEEENLKRQQEVFGLQDNTPPEQDPDDGEKVDE